MPKASYVQEQFLGGEWSPFAQGRFSDREYKRAMKVCFNAFPLEEGAWVRRSGFRRAGPTLGGKTARMFKFEFTRRSPVTLEFTDNAMRAWQGASIVSDGTSGTVGTVGDDGAGNAIFDQVDDPGWSVGDHIIFQFTDEATALHNATLANRHFQIVTYSLGNFTCKDIETGVVVTRSDIGFESTDKLTASRILELTTPFPESSLPVLRRVATDDDGVSNCILLDGRNAPQELTVENTDPSTLSIDDVVFRDGPYLDPTPGAILTPGATSGLASMTLSFQAYSSTKVYSRGDTVTSSNITYRSLQNVNLNHSPASNATWWEVTNPGVAFGPSGMTTDDIGRHIRLQSADGNWRWGKVTSLSTSGVINPTLAGSVAIGNMTEQGGLAGAFKGARQSYSKSAVATKSNNTSHTATHWIGHDFSGATAQSITSVTVRAPTGSEPYTPGTFPAAVLAAYQPPGDGSTLNITVTIELRASNTSPGSDPTTGTKLASTSYALHVVLNQIIVYGLDTAIQNSSVTLISNDQSTTWKYVWVVFKWTSTGGRASGFTFVTSVGELDMTSSNIVAGTGFTMQIFGLPLPDTTPITTFTVGLYAPSSVYPANGCYHEGRFWLSGAVDNRLDSSCSNDPFNFAPSGSNGTVGDNNAISATLNSSDVNSIYWMMPDLQGILIGTKGGEWLLQASNSNNILTPTSRQAHRITKYGCANIEPARTGLTTCFIQKFKRRVHEFLSDVFSGKFYAPNLTELAKHVTASNVEEIDYQEELAPIVWNRKGDGTLAGCTYRRVSMLSNQPPEFRGWHRHEHGSGHTITSIAVGPSLYGNLDALTVAALDADGDYSVQVMDKLFDEEDVLTNARFLDNYLVPAVAQVTSTGFLISGLVPFAGDTKSIFLCGLDCGEHAIGSDGTVAVLFKADPDKLLTQAYCENIIDTAGASDGDINMPLFDADDTLLGSVPCIVGDAFTSKGQIVPPMDAGGTGAKTGPAFGKVTKHSGVAALLHSTVGISFGVDFDRMLPAVFKSRGGKGTTLLRKDQPFSGTHYMPINDEGTAMDNSICWEVTRPYPATVVAVGGFDGTEDR